MHESHEYTDHLLLSSLAGLPGNHFGKILGKVSIFSSYDGDPHMLGKYLLAAQFMKAKFCSA